MDAAYYWPIPYRRINHMHIMGVHEVDTDDLLLIIISVNIFVYMDIILIF